ncbi:T9SS type A sorting domain-containing protein [Soonwooa purpurea]
MKKFYSLLAIAAIACGLNAQTQIFKETFGNPSANTSVNTYTGYDNSAPIVFTAGTSGTDIRSNSASTVTDYAEASGQGNVMINSATKYLLISGISTENFENVSLKFGQRKGTNAANNELKVEVSGDEGATWTQLAYTRPTGSGTAKWTLVTTTGNIPQTQSLQIKFSGTNPTEWRIDDIILTGTENVLCTNPTIDEQPADQTVNLGDSASFSVVATGDNLTYQWQMLATDQTTWTDIPEEFSASATTATLTTPATIEFSNGFKFRVVISSGTCQTISDEATLTVDSTLATGNSNATKANLVKNTVVANEIIFGQDAKVSVINMAGQVVKTAEVKENARLDVSNLAKGTYIVTATVNGKAVSQKIIKK